MQLRKTRQLPERPPQRGLAEEDPRQTYDVEDDDAAPPHEEQAPRLRHVATAGQQALERQHPAVDRAPDDEGPVGAMPQAAKQHGGHQVGIGAHAPLAVAAEGYVEVVAQPGAEADVPAAPEVLQALG